jgi:hypothetical protein
MARDTQTNSSPEPQSSDSHGELSDRDIEELISFFKLLDEWDREAQV